MLQKKIKGNKKKGQLFIVGSLIVLIGMSIFTIEITSLVDQNIEDKKALDVFYEKQEKMEEIISNEPIEVAEEKIQEIREKKKNNTVNYNYIAVLKIPKINLERGLVSKDDKYNNVEYNIMILKESTMPNIDKGNFILAAHSGSGYNAYFRNVDKLKLNDEVIILYDGLEYKYKVMNIYDIEKTGTAEIIRNYNKTTLTLITCRDNTNNQIIVICELID